MRRIGLAFALVMNRRAFVCGLVGTLTAPRVAVAQQAVEPPKIGVLATASRKTSAAGWASFPQGLRDLGWEDGRNIVIEDDHAILTHTISYFGGN